MVRIKRARSWKQPIQPSSNLHYTAPVPDPPIAHCNDLKEECAVLDRHKLSHQIII